MFFGTSILHWVCRQYIPQLILIVESIEVKLAKIEKDNEEILKLLRNK